MRIVSIRSAVYMAEQDCPYEEEYDGNDLSATHLLGYIGNEPAGCLRIRYFGNFAKFERLAVRHEFRTSKLSFRLVRAGIDLCRKKGYRRIYGHARKDLVRFWQIFGFRVIPDRDEFHFSDVAYIEMALDIVPNSEALRVGDDPYVLIRPEGRWDQPGILERSSTRGVRSMAKENRS
ncbi:MAG: GNAT family N-acetyltransferase [Alphaproteobacteria bacterium]|nr:GNAT family N-acetyltransferase [Alphaproteobacteria bacterium]